MVRLAKVRGALLWRSFARMAERPDQVQQQLLQRILRANQETAFGHQHGFGNMVTVADYQAAVPVGDYERFRPWIDRMREGERDVLTVDEPYMFTLTSGTTGQPKSIPVNSATRRSTSRLSALWLYRALRDHPKALDGKALLVVSPAVEGYTQGGTPFGSASGYIYQNAAWAIRRSYALPYAVFSIADYDAKYYAIMRLALEHDISLLITPNPSTMMRLVTTADGRHEQIIRDIHDGTIDRELDIAPELRRELLRRLKPNPRRAYELEQIVTREGFLDPRGYWPGLTLVGCWKGGSVGVAVERLRPWFGDEMPFRDIGYLASEAQMTLPVQDKGSAGILALNTNFYEFIREGEMERRDTHVLTAEQLEEGENYYVLLTTPTGLYRYDINDVVRVAGFYRRTPMLEFVRKGRDMVSLTGEKLHVGQLIQSMAVAQEHTGIHVAHYRAIGNAETSRYEVMLEAMQYPVTDAALLALGRVIDEQLGALNIEYDQKRRSGRLGPPCIMLMPEGWHARRLRAKVARGAGDIQFKDALLGLPDAEDEVAQPIKQVTVGVCEVQ